MLRGSRFELAAESIELTIDHRGGGFESAHELTGSLLQVYDVPSYLHVGRAYRRRLQCDPEAVLQQSGLEARSVAAFLHENVLEFVAHDGIDSAADILAHLSDAGTCRPLQRNFWQSRTAQWSALSTQQAPRRLEQIYSSIACAEVFIPRTMGLIQVTYNNGTVSAMQLECATRDMSRH